METSLKPFIHRKVVVLSHLSTAYEAARAMEDHSIGCIFVSDESDQIAGVVTDRDLLLRVFARGLSANTGLLDVMSKDVKSVPDTSDLSEVLQLMERYSIRRVPVTAKVPKNEYQKCVGLVSLDDLLASEVIPTSQLGRVVQSQIRGQHKIYRNQARHGIDSTEASEFLRSLCKRLGHDLELVESFSRFVLSSISQRIHYTAAMQFIAEIPPYFRSELYDLAAGPDRKIDAKYITDGAAIRLHVDPLEAKDAVHTFWVALCESGDINRLMHTLVQLPSDIQILLTGGNQPKPEDYSEERTRFYKISKRENYL